VPESGTVIEKEGAPNLEPIGQALQLGTAFKIERDSHSEPIGQALQLGTTPENE
jgi:hypothetical protein